MKNCVGLILFWLGIVALGIGCIYAVLGNVSFIHFFSAPFLIVFGLVVRICNDKYYMIIFLMLTGIAILTAMFYYWTKENYILIICFGSVIGICVIARWIKKSDCN